RTVLIASPYVPFPLAHGGAVRMYNLMRRAAERWDQVLVCFAPSLERPPAELLDVASEVVLVRHAGSHSRPSTARPDVVEEFDSAAFHAALRMTVRKWRPAIAQLEFTQMAQYASDCLPAARVLVEHDVTFDLYEQLLASGDDWEVGRQLERWRRFETAAWRGVERVVTMSERDRRLVGDRAVTIPNGVDLERFRPSDSEPEPARLLFIGSFAHLPNLLAVEFFLERVWPGLEGATLHIIAGARHEYFLDYYRDRASVDLERPRVEVEGFVADVRPAYRRASVVIAPLVVSAGTNIKIMEAMAMGKAIVTTPAGVNGLDVEGEVAVARTAEDFAGAVRELVRDPEKRKQLEWRARQSAGRRYDWDEIARRQEAMYRAVTATANPATASTA
ncbi:MAG: glycosyltransferase, partial [Bryobacteraceae bacterium]